MSWGPVPLGRTFPWRAGGTESPLEDGVARESDVWLGGLFELMVKAGCWELGCPFVVHGELGELGRIGTLVIAHSRKVRVEIKQEQLIGVGRVEYLGITETLIADLKAAHAAGDVPPRIEVEDDSVAGN